MPETRDEAWERCEKTGQTVLKKKLHLYNISVEIRVYGVKKTQKESKIYRYYFRLQYYKHRNDMLKKANILKGINIFINEDNSYKITEDRKELWEEVRRP